MPDKAMQQQMIEQLYAEVYQCRVLLQATAERLALLSQTIRQLQAGAGFPADTALPPTGLAAKDGEYNLPPASSAANPAPGDLPLMPLPANPAPIPLPPGSLVANPGSYTPAPRQLSRVLKQKVFGKTTNLHLRRTAELMLFIRQYPGVARGVAPYAELLGMGYSGAAKFVMHTCRRGLIKRTAFKVYALTAQGEAYVQEALLPAAKE